MAGNKHRHGAGWPSYGVKGFEKGPAADYSKVRKRGPAQTPKRPVEAVAELVE